MLCLFVNIIKHFLWSCWYYLWIKWGQLKNSLSFSVVLRISKSNSSTYMAYSTTYKQTNELWCQSYTWRQWGNNARAIWNYRKYSFYFFTSILRGFGYRFFFWPHRSVSPVGITSPYFPPSKICGGWWVEKSWVVVPYLDRFQSGRLAWSQNVFEAKSLDHIFLIIQLESNLWAQLVFARKFLEFDVLWCTILHLS